jgi:hypothetical protein
MRNDRGNSSFHGRRVRLSHGRVRPWNVQLPFSVLNPHCQELSKFSKHWAVSRDLCSLCGAHFPVCPLSWRDPERIGLFRFGQMLIG